MSPLREGATVRSSTSNRVRLDAVSIVGANLLGRLASVGGCGCISHGRVAPTAATSKGGLYPIARGIAETVRLFPLALFGDPSLAIYVLVTSLADTQALVVIGVVAAVVFRGAAEAPSALVIICIVSVGGAVRALASALVLLFVFALPGARCLKARLTPRAAAFIRHATRSWASGRLIAASALPFATALLTATLAWLLTATTLTGLLTTALTFATALLAAALTGPLTTALTFAALLAAALTRLVALALAALITHVFPIFHDYSLTMFEDLRCR